MAVRFPGIGRTMQAFRANLHTMPPTPKLTHNPLILSKDIDETLIPWQKQPNYNALALQRYSDLLNQPETRHNSFLLLNTGRGLKGVQVLIPILKKFPVDALVTNDGQQLFLRAHTTKAITSENKPDTEAWLSSLTHKDEDALWKAQLKGWCTSNVMQATSRSLSKLGFALQDTHAAKAFEVTTEGVPHLFTKPIERHQPNGTQWVVKLYPDQAYIEVTRSDRKPERQTIANYADHLGAELRENLLSHWPTASYYTNIANKRTYVHLGPAGNSKASPLHHLAGTRFDVKPKAVVSAGDSFNDRDILSTASFGDIPNYPIQVGKHAALSEHLKNNRPPHLEQTEADQLDSGLRKQFAKLKHLLPFLDKKEPASEVVPLSNRTKFDRLA